MRFVYGIIMIAVGILVMRYTYGLVQLFGKVDWAERNLGAGFGGTYALYKIVGVIIVVVAMLYMFGGAGFLVKPFAPVFGG
jgi:hypothetical protein